MTISINNLPHSVCTMYAYQSGKLDKIAVVIEFVGVCPPLKKGDIVTRNIERDDNLPPGESYEVYTDTFFIRESFDVEIDKVPMSVKGVKAIPVYGCYAVRKEDDDGHSIHRQLAGLH